MNIVMFPDCSKDNKYIELIRNALENLDIKINSLNETLNNKKKFNETEYFIFNWYESLYTNSLLNQSKIFIKKFRLLINLKLNNKKIIWVLHNKIPHDDKYVFYSKFLMKWLVNNSYKIIIHSNESKKIINELTNSLNIMDKVVYIPHPNYIGAYKEYCNFRYDANKELNLLFIGAIKPYKNVDLLIKVFNELKLENVVLTLAGKTSSKQYEEYINSLINENPNIITYFRFIEDDEIISFINKSNMIVLPYDIKSSLNSGTIFLAFSNKRTVLSPMIGTLKDIKNDNLFFTYDYKTDYEHRDKLKESISNIYNIYINGNYILQDMGNKCYEVVKNENTLDKISQIFNEKIFNNRIDNVNIGDK